MERPAKTGPRVLAAIRKMIVTGELRDGQRIAEIPTAERLGVSRMPVRTALRSLEQEGLVVRLGARGYAARTASRTQIEAAIAVRGVLEGLAAALAANHPERAGAALDAIVDAGERLFANPAPSDLPALYYSYNRAFHQELIAQSENEAIKVALARNDHLPFASATAMVFDVGTMPGERDHLLGAHREHQAVVAAIRAGDAAEAERLMRRHARISLANLATYEAMKATALT